MKKILLLVLIASSVQGFTQPSPDAESLRLTPELYIEMFREAAMVDMKKTGVPASITLAQGMYESDFGNSPLAKSANNHFGIKCHKEWTGPAYYQDDDAPNECFRKYESVLESYDDHSLFLRSRERYQFLFELDVTDYKGWAHGLKKAGYATNPAYASRLIGLIERYKLYEYDTGGQKMPVSDAMAVAGPAGTGQESGHPKPHQSKPQHPKSHHPKPHHPKPEARRKIATPVNVAPAAENMVNGVPFVKAGEGDTWTKLASENNLDLWQILEFNDAAKNEVFAPGEIVFIRPKKTRGVDFYHTVGEGQTMRDIAQLYAIRLSSLYKMNEMDFGTEPGPGTRIYLKRAMILGVVL